MEILIQRPQIGRLQAEKPGYFVPIALFRFIGMRRRRDNFRNSNCHTIILVNINSISANQKQIGCGLRLANFFDQCIDAGQCFLLILQMHPFAIHLSFQSIKQQADNGKPNTCNQVQTNGFQSYFTFNIHPGLLYDAEQK